MDGIVVRRNIEEGETAVVGTMNNAGSQLLTIADMSVLEAEVEVDETDIPTVALGQEAKVTIDAVPDRTFRGRVTEIGNSPIQAATQQGGQRQATTFKVVITLEEEVPERPAGLHLHGRDHHRHAQERHVRADPGADRARDAVRSRRARSCAKSDRPTPAAQRRRDDGSASNEPPPGHTRKETEGVFVVRDGKAVFTPVKIGVAGEQYFEVTRGPQGRRPGDHRSVRLGARAGRRRRRSSCRSRARHTALRDRGRRTPPRSK